MSDVELDDEYDDFDPLGESDDDDAGAAAARAAEGAAGPAPASAPPDAGGDGDGSGSDSDSGSEGEGEGAAAADAAVAAEADDPPPRKPTGRRPAAGRPVHQAEGTRRVFVVASEDRVTSNMMTLAEMARAIAVRAKQISTHPNAYTDVGDLTDATKIARKELFDRRSPLVLRRVVGPATIELWCVREMSFSPMN